MDRSVVDWLSLAAQVGTWIDEALRRPAGATQRTGPLAEMLSTLWPRAPLYACLLQENGKPQGAVLDASGKPRPEWGPILQRALQELTGPEQRPMPGELKLKGQLLAAPVNGQGTLAVGAADGASAEDLAALKAVLRLAADELALRLRLQALEMELAAESRLASVGELARPVAHEFNNFLNVLLLHIAVLDLEVGDRLRSELTEVRRQGTGMANLIRHFQRLRQQHHEQAGPVDVNGAVRAALAGLGNGAPIDLHLTPTLPPVPAAPTDLKRLLQFLLANTLSLDPPARHIAVYTAPGDDQVMVRIEDDGPPVPDDDLERLFDAQASVRAGTNALELAACRGLARRWQATLRAENRAEGGLAIVLTLPTTEQ